MQNEIVEPTNKLKKKLHKIKEIIWREREKANDKKKYRRKRRMETHQVIHIASWTLPNYGVCSYSTAHLNIIYIYFKTMETIFGVECFYFCNFNSFAFFSHSHISSTPSTVPYSWLLYAYATNSKLMNSQKQTKKCTFLSKQYLLVCYKCSSIR